MNRKRLVLILLIVLVIVITTYGLKKLYPESGIQRQPSIQKQPETTGIQKQPETGPQIGLMAPNFSLNTLDGRTVKLSDFRGKPVIVNFWASWCPPCKAEIPEIEKFYEQNKTKVQVLAINITFNDKLTDVQNILKANNVQFPVLLDENGQASVADAYQVDSIPASFFIDKAGVIREIHVGGMILETLKEAVRKTE